MPDRAAGRQRRRLARRRSAMKRPDGTYNIKGTKIFISGGDQDMTENIVHMVLARTPDAPAGTKGLSLFIVPEDPPRRHAERRHGRRHRAQDGHQGVVDRAARVRRERQLRRRARRHDGAEGHVPDVPPDELRAHRRRRSGPVDRVERRTSTRSSTRRTASRAARSSSGRMRPRRACRSSSTPTSAACCST